MNVRMKQEVVINGTLQQVTLFHRVFLLRLQIIHVRHVSLLWFVERG